MSVTPSVVKALFQAAIACRRGAGSQNWDGLPAWKHCLDLLNDPESQADLKDEALYCEMIQILGEYKAAVTQLPSFLHSFQQAFPQGISKDSLVTLAIVAYSSSDADFHHRIRTQTQRWTEYWPNDDTILERRRQQSR